MTCLSDRQPQIKYDGHLSSGYAQCFSATFVEMATAYTNSVVELFKPIVSRYLFYSVKMLFEQMSCFYTYVLSAKDTP